MWEISVCCGIEGNNFGFFAITNALDPVNQYAMTGRKGGTHVVRYITIDLIDILLIL